MSSGARADLAGGCKMANSKTAKQCVVNFINNHFAKRWFNVMYDVAKCWLQNG